jgi:hypothetical protein
MSGATGTPAAKLAELLVESSGAGADGGAGELPVGFADPVLGAADGGVWTSGFVTGIVTMLLV